MSQPQSTPSPPANSSDRGGGGEGRGGRGGRGSGRNPRGREPRTPQQPGGRGPQQQQQPVKIHSGSGVPFGYVPAYLPGSASLVEELNQRIMIVLRDGKHLVGVSGK